MGPGPYGISDDRCIDCTDDNCALCGYSWNECQACFDGYSLNDSGECVPLLYGR